MHRTSGAQVRGLNGSIKWHGAQVRGLNGSIKWHGAQVRGLNGSIKWHGAQVRGLNDRIWKLEIIQMNKLIAAAFCAINLTVPLAAQDVTRLEPIGTIINFTRTDNGVAINCNDNSHVQLSVLAPDLIRVRTSFAKPIPAKDHSWAIAKENWERSPWNVTDTPESITLATA